MLNTEIEKLKKNFYSNSNKTIKNCKIGYGLMTDTIELEKTKWREFMFLEYVNALHNINLNNICNKNSNDIDKINYQIQQISIFIRMFTIYGNKNWEFGKRLNGLDCNEIKFILEFLSKDFNDLVTNGKIINNTKFTYFLKIFNKITKY